VQIVDLTTGARQPLDSGSSQVESLAWSPDSQWLFGIADQALVAWKAGSAETRHLTFDGEPILVTEVGVFPTG
jgi:Dipeptidyl peptidase IV (DPP IV) N-terminal region